MEKNQFFKDINGTILEDIFLVQPGDIVEPTVKVAVNEWIVGQMTGLEKCAQTLFSESDKAARQIMEAFDKEMKWRIEVEKVPSEGLPELAPDVMAHLGLSPKKIFKMFRGLHFLQDFLFVTINGRLDVPLGYGLALRKGFTIVTAKDQGDSLKNDLSKRVCQECSFKTLCNILKNTEFDFCNN